MKKLLLTGLLLTAAFSFAADKLNVDIWNKTEQPLYFELGTPEVPPTGKKLVELQVSKAKNATVQDRIISGLKFGTSSALNYDVKGDFAQTKINGNQKTLILLSRTKDIKPGSKVTLVTVNPGKDIIVRLLADSKGSNIFAGDLGKYIFGPQTGPLGGLFGTSERGLALGNNVKQSDLSINPNYVIPASIAVADVTEKSAREKELDKALGNDPKSILSPDQLKAVETLKGLGISD